MTTLSTENIAELNEIAAQDPDINIYGTLVQNSQSAVVFTKIDNLTVDSSHGVLSTEGLLLLGRLIGSSDTLTSLSMNDNSIGENAEAFANTIAQSPSLKTLYMDSTNIGEQAEAFAKAIAKTHSLETLYMEGNNIGEHAVAFAHAIAEAPSLKTLDIRDINIGEQAEAFANAIAKAPSLETLYMENNNIGEHAVAFAHAIAQAPSLKTLKMRDNLIKAEELYEVQAILVASNIETSDLLGFAEVVGQHKNVLAEINELLAEPLLPNLAHIVSSYFSLPTDAELAGDAPESQLLLGEEHNDGGE